jgi:hypothetical protein
MELNTHAMAIPSQRGGGNHGHLALVMTDAEYLALTQVAFDIPLHPGPTPAPGATGPIITENNRRYAAAIVDFELYHKTDRELKALLLQAVPLPFIQQLRNIRFGFSQVLTADILEHLDITYGTVTSDDLKANINNMDAPWSGDRPLEDLWTQISEAVQYAEGHDNISDKQAVRSAEINLERSGLFTDDYKFWMNKPRAEQTFANIMIHFNTANKARLRTQTTINAGYSIVQPPVLQPKDTNAQQNKKEELSGWKYCWTHGVNRSHNSHNCLYPKDKHVKTATIGNPKGGSTGITYPNRNRTPPIVA